MSKTDTIQKLRTLAERGATEGERAAAQAALERIEARLQAEAAFKAPAVTPTGFHDLLAGVQTAVLTDEEINRIVDSAFADFGMHQSSATHHHGRVWFDRS